MGVPTGRGQKSPAQLCMAGPRVTLRGSGGAVLSVVMEVMETGALLGCSPSASASAAEL